MASTSRVSEKSLSLQPMNSNNYTAAQDGVQSLTNINNQNIDNNESDNAISLKNDTDNQQIGNSSVETGSSPINQSIIDNGEHGNNSSNSNSEVNNINNQSDSSVGDTATDLSKISLNTTRLSRGSNSPLNNSVPRQCIQMHQQFQDYPPIPIQRFSPNNNSQSNTILQNSPNSPKLMSSLTNSYSTRLNSPAIPFEDKLSNGGNNMQVKRNKSPFRDSSNGYVKQIKTQRRPLYTPAVLRVTENNTSTSLPLSHSDSNHRADSFGSRETDGSPPPSFNTNIPPQRPKLTYRNSSSSSVRSNNSSVVEYATDYLNAFASKFLNTPDSNPESKNGPTRSHWKSNNSRFSCANCNRIFNYLSVTRRRHHCRYCGEIFCSDCLNNFVYLNKDAKFVMIGGSTEEEETKDFDYNNNLEDKFLSKSCHNCFLKYEEFLKRNSQDIIDANDAAAVNGSNKDNDKNKDKNNSSKNANPANTTNIPVDWDWSSF